MAKAKEIGDPSAKLVRDRWDAADRSLMQERKDFWLNVAFFEGYQWIRWDDRKRVIQNTFTPSRYENQRMRVTINKIQERINMLMGRFCQRNLEFEAQASAPDDATLTRAKKAEAIIDDRREALGWEAIREENVFDTLMGGTAAIMHEWDGSAGDRLWITEGSRQVVGKGEVKLTPLSIAEFSMEPGVRRWSDANWFVVCMVAPPEQVQATYNMKETPEPDVNSGQTRHSMFAALGSNQKPDLTNVFVLYERPNANCKKGRHVVVVNDKAIIDAEWPFKTDELNIQVSRCLKVSGRWTGRTIVTSARTPQILYNIVRSSMAEHMKLAGNVRLLIAHGSLDDDVDMTDEPGEELRYYGDGQFNKPTYLEPPTVNRGLREQADEIEAELDGILHSHAVSRGEAPGDRNSGLALSILAEKNDTPLGPMARDQAYLWSRTGSAVLRLYSEMAPEKREATMKSPHGVTQTLVWDKDTIGDQWKVRVPLESVMPTSKIATQAMLTQAAQAFPNLASSISPEKLVDFFSIPGIRALDVLISSDARLAQYENERMSAGEVEIPEPWHNHAQHITEHNEFRNSTEWISLSDELKQMVEAHVQAHQRFVEEEAVSQAHLNSVSPGLGGLPQANNPIGSALPPPASQSNVIPMQGARPA